MIDYLHNKINDIVPINGLFYSEQEKSYSISYKSEPTEEQLSLVHYTIASWPLESARLSKLNEIDDCWKLTVKNGWTTPYGWKLGIDAQDITLLTGIFVLTKEASQLGLPQNATIMDMDGVPHEFNLEDLTSLMLQYGAARKQLSEEYAEKIRLAKEALTVQELEWIICQ